MTDYLIFFLHNFMTIFIHHFVCGCWHKLESISGG